MPHLFEIYILGDEITADNWVKLYRALNGYLGALASFQIIFRCTDNVVRFFLVCDKDVSSLSTNIEGMLLRQANQADIELPDTAQKDHFLKYTGANNILDLKEKLSIKKSLNLQFAHLRIRAINFEKAIVRVDYYLQNAGGGWVKTTRTQSAFPASHLAINFATNTRYLKRSVPKYLNIEKSLHMLSSENLDALFEIDTFPYFSHNYYLNLTSYEFDRHSFIIGASGSGKSKFIALFVDRLARTSLKMNYRVVVIDPHASLADDFEHLPDSKVISFGKQDNADLFPGAGTDLTSATELTSTLFKSILSDQFNPRLDRLMRFSLFTLMTAQAMSLENLKRFLTDAPYRIQIIEHVTGYIPDNVVKFFGGDFNELRTQYYNETVMPIVSMIDEMQLQPSLVGESETSLAHTIQENFLTVFSLNKVSMGDKVVRTVAGLLIQQIFLLAQARAFNQKVLLIIDEVSVVQNPALAQILAEARKFNLTVILTQQYFGQVEKDLRDAIFANVFNYYSFKVSEEDARALEGNLNIELPKELVEEEHKKGLKESDVRVKMMTELHPRECLVRLLSNGQVAPAVKARTIDAPITKLDRPTVLHPATQQLPEKFIEGGGPEKPSLSNTAAFETPPSANDAPTSSAQESQPIHQPNHVGDVKHIDAPGDKRRFSSVRDLLSLQSSSRDKITKNDDDKGEDE